MTTQVWRHALVLFAIMIAHALLETARDAVLLRKLGPDALAVAYIVIAALAVVTMTIMRRLGATRRPVRVLVAMLAIAALGTVVVALTVSITPGAALVLYGWSGVVATLVVPTFWVVVERGINVADAKRAFGVVAAGGAAGALVGFSIAFGLSHVLAPHHLAIAAGAAFALASLVAVVLAPTDVPKHEQPSIRADDAEPPRSSSYLRLLLVLGLVSTVTLTLGDLMFKRVLAERLPGESLAGWLAAIYGGLNVIALVVQVVATSRLLRYGVGTALTVLPVLVLATALGFVLTGSLVAVIGLKLADGGLRHSLHRVATEILYIPVPSTLRQSAKPIIDAVAQRGGQAFAALIALVVAADTTTLAFVLLAGVILWLVAVALTRTAYVRQFRRTLETHDIQRDVNAPTLDRASVEMLMASLASPDQAEAAAALDLLAMREEGIPALVLYHPNPAIVRRALGSLRSKLRPDVARVLQQLATHADSEVRAAAIAVSNRGGYPPSPTRLDDPDAHVRAATAVALHDGPDAPRALDALTALLEGTTADRLALAHAIGNEPSDRFRVLLVHLLARREPAVVRAVLRVWQQVPSLADQERLLALLAYSHVRGDARRALLALGGLDRLIAGLEDPRTPLAVRRHVPRTISRFGTPAAAAALAADLVREPDGTTEFKILRALGRMRADNPHLPVEAAPLRKYITRSLEDAKRYRQLREAVSTQAAPTLSLLAELLHEKRQQAIERVFRALGVLYPSAGLRSIHDAIAGLDDERRSAAREILDEAVPADLRMPLVDELDAKARDRAPNPYPTLDAALRALLSDTSDSLRSFAAHHVARSRLVELRDELVRLKPTTGSTLVALAFDQAIASLHA